MPNLAGMSLIKFYYILQNVRVAAFTVSQFSKRKPIGKRERVKFSHPTQIRVKIKFLFIMLYISWLYSGA